MNNPASVSLLPGDRDSSAREYSTGSISLKEELASQVLTDIVPLTIPKPVTIPEAFLPSALGLMP